MQITVGPLWIAIMALGAMGCASSARTAFRPSDPLFVAAPGPEPRVFDAPDVEQLPEGPLRSVGTIEVTAHASDSAADVARRAAAHGRQVGCSILVEQEAFRRIGPRSTLLHGARFELACAVHGNLRHAPPPPHRTISFECVVVGGLATTRA